MLVIRMLRITLHMLTLCLGRGLRERQKTNRQNTTERFIILETYGFQAFTLTSAQSFSIIPI
jgi:hypothetical protein